MPSEVRQTTAAQSRIEKIIGRVFSSAAMATSIETLLNAMPQSKFLNPWMMYGSVGMILLAQLAQVWTFWFGRANRNVYVFHGLAYFLAFVIYPFSVTTLTQFPVDYRPWLWWATGTAAMALGFLLPKWWSVAFVVFIPVSWFALRLTLIGGSASGPRAILDSAYIVLFSATVVSLVTMMRSAALRVDQAKDAETAGEIKRITEEAKIQERERLDGLIHDQVLTTLILAANARDSKQEELAGISARDAIARLNEATEENDGQAEDSISAAALFDTLQNAVKRIDPACECNTTRNVDLVIPLRVAVALMDATVQSLRNSTQHAGSKAKRQVRMKADETSLKIVVKDDGKGFWESKIPKNRLGIRSAIRGRVTAVGGQVAIQAAPRKGASIVLSWSANA